MVARAGVYYGPPFKGCRGVTQGYPLSPTIFNMVVDFVIGPWVTVVAATEAGTERLVLSIWYLAVYLYSNNGLVASNQLERLHQVFGVLACLFDRVGLRMNTWKKVIMACKSCHTPVRMFVVK